MDSGMRIERTMRLYFGKKAYGTAGEFNNPKNCRRWLKKVIRLIMKQIDTLDTTPGHKQLIMENTETAENAIGRSDNPSWELVFCLVALIGRLLGFYLEGTRCHSLAYFHQTPNQYFTEKVMDGENDSHYYDDAISIRKELIQFLKENKNLSDFKVALVLNSTEYEIKKLRKDL